LPIIRVDEAGVWRRHKSGRSAGGYYAGAEETHEMIDRAWREMIQGFEGIARPLASPDEVDGVVALMVDMRIDPLKFSGNLMAILRQGTLSFGEILGEDQPFVTTPSVERYTSVINRPAGTPLWMLAGFPDVIQWLNERIIEYHRSYEGGGQEHLLELYGVDLDSAEDGGEIEFRNSSGQIRVCYYRNLISNYRTRTGNILETSVIEGSENDVYMGSDLLASLGEASNFTLIASMTTKYYIELEKLHGHRFPDEISLLATAGILDANVYVFVTQKIKPEQIIAIARGVRDSKERLLDFIVRLEVLLISVDSPDYAIDEVELACEEQSAAIKSAIDHTINSYTGEPHITAAVQGFMGSSWWSEIRNALGIR
jgi:hypothetical protein